MTPDEVAHYFTRSDGAYLFARWGRPIAPVIFGVEDASLPVLKGAIEAVVTLAGHEMAETDPELGANLMIFFLKDWNELLDVPNMGDLVPNLAPLVARLQTEDANQYRFFRFEEAGAIQAAFLFIRMDQALADLPAEALALGQIVQAILLWSDRAFAQTSPLAILSESGATVLKPDVANLIRAAYDPVMPTAADDPSHAHRLAARIGILA